MSNIPKHRRIATPDDMVARFDERDLEGLCFDGTDQQSSQTLQTNPKMAAALASAEGRVRGALFRNGRYNADDLDKLDDTDRAYLADLVCQFAYCALWRRRPVATSDESSAIERMLDDARESLKLILSGEFTLNLPGPIDAGTPSVEAPSITEIVTDWELQVDKADGRLYPRRRTYRNRR